MCPQGACTRGCKVILVAFVCRTICSAAIPAKNWNSSCSSAVILFPARQIHEDNLHWQQRHPSHNMFSGGACTRGCKVTLVAFVCRTICSATIPAKNWKSSLFFSGNSVSCAANTWGQFMLTTETAAAQYVQRRFLFLRGKIQVQIPAKNCNNDDFWKPVYKLPHRK